MAGTLVLKQFQIDHTGASGANLYVKARSPGIIAFILNLMGLDPTATVKVDRGSIEFRSSSIKGMDSVTSGLTSVAGFIGGYRKPIWILVIGFLAFIGSIGLTIHTTTAGYGCPGWQDSQTYVYSQIGDGVENCEDGYDEDDGAELFAEQYIIGSVFFLFSIVAYILGKVMYIGFETSGGAKYMIAFKRSVIEGVAVDIARIEVAITLVNSLISSASSGTNMTSTQNVQSFGKQATLSYAETPVTQTSSEHPGWKWDAEKQEWLPE